MLELRESLASVVACHAAADVLDGFTIEATVAVRVAQDEVLLISEPSRCDQVLVRAEEALAPVDGLVVDVSDGYAVWTLHGDWREAWARLCAVPSPPASACVQGLFAGVPAKLVSAEEELLVMASSALSEHVRERVLSACHDLDPHELEPTPLSVPADEAAV